MIDEKTRKADRSVHPVPRERSHLADLRLHHGARHNGRRTAREPGDRADCAKRCPQPRSRRFLLIVFILPALIAVSDRLIRKKKD